MVVRLDYNKEKFIRVRVCSIECDVTDIRIGRTLASDVPLHLGSDGVLWLYDGGFVYR